MTDNVVQLNCLTTLDLDAAKILKAIADEKPDHVVVLAVKDGEITYHSSTADEYKVLYYVESFKHYLMSGGFQNDD